MQAQTALSQESINCHHTRMKTFAAALQVLDCAALQILNLPNLLDSESERGSARDSADCGSEPEFRSAESTRDSDRLLTLPAGECPSPGIGGV